MKAVTKVFAGAGVVALTAGAFAAPAAAQYYPGYGQSGAGNVIGQVLDTVLNAQRYGQGAYGYANDQAMIGRCAAAVEQRINRDYGYRYGSQYGGYGQQGYNQYAQGGAKVVGITRVERRSSSTTRVRGVATANAYAGGGYGNPYGGYNQPYGGSYGAPYGSYGQAYPQYGYAPQGEITFKCDIDYRGYIRDIDVDRNRNAYRRY